MAKLRTKQGKTTMIVLYRDKTSSSPGGSGAR